MAQTTGVLRWSVHTEAALGRPLPHGRETELDAALCSALGGSIEGAGRPAALAMAARRVVAGADFADLADLAAADRVFAHGLRRLLANLTSDLDALRESIVDLARPHLGERFSRAHPNQPVALLGGLHALGVALAPAIEPDAALLSVVRLGEAADTVGALCGALLAARFGSGWIPLDRLPEAHRLR